MEELIYHYKAFISHTERDSEWAKKLHTRLNHYSIPSKIKKEHPELPKNLRPVFWYKRDISELHLMQTIRKELYNSEYLIVICSPESAQKPWVNEEVRIFKEEFGRGDKIIPFVVDGVSNSNNPAEECFPLLLRNLTMDEQIRGIDIRGEDGIEGAIINVIATMLHVRYDELYQRHLREKKKRLYSYIVAATISLISLLYIWDFYFHTKYEYFLDYADCNGWPTGIIPIDADIAKKEYRTYRFEYLQNKLRRVVYVDSNGNIQPFSFTEYFNRFSIQELLYENEEYVGLECKSHLGDVICRYTYSKDKNAVNITDDQNDLATSVIRSASAIVNDDEKNSQSHFIDNILRSPSKIGRYEYKRDSLGFITTIYYCKNPYQSQRTTDVNGIAGIHYERDSLHRVVKLMYLGLDGNLKSDEHGVAYKKYGYNEKGYLTLSEYYNLQGDLQNNELGWAKAIVEYNSNGYYTRESLFGNDGKSCKSIRGESITKYVWKDNTMCRSFFDEDETPILLHGSASVPGGYHMLKETYDSNGDVITHECYNLEGSLCYNSQHWAIAKNLYNKRRHVEQSYWSPEDEPCINYHYVHRIKTTYQDGLIETQSYWGPNGTKMVGPTGFHSAYFDYEHRRMTRVRTYNILDILCSTQTLVNAAQVDIEYKEGYPSAVYFRDVNGKLCLDEQRNINNPIMPYRDWAVCRVSNENGMNTEYAYYDENDKKMLCFGKYHKKTIEYNEVGQVFRTSFYDTDNQVALNEGGFSVMETHYDSINPHLPSFIYFKGRDLELCNNNNGFAIQKNKYNINGKLESTAYFDKNNNAAYDAYGVHSYKYKYDHKGRTTHIIAMAENNKKAIHIQQKCHIMENIYDDYNRVIEMRRYDVNEKLVTRPIPAIVCFFYGIDHQVIRSEFLDNNRQLCNNPEGGNIAVVIKDYDALGKLTHERFLDEKGYLAINTAMGYAEAIRRQNKLSNVISFKDEEGEYVNVQGTCRRVEICSDNSLPLLYRMDYINLENELEIYQLYLWKYNSQESFAIYEQNQFGNIVVFTPPSSTNTIYEFEEEYDSLQNMIFVAQDSLMKQYLNMEF